MIPLVVAGLASAFGSIASGIFGFSSQRKHRKNQRATLDKYNKLAKQGAYQNYRKDLDRFAVKTSLRAYSDSYIANTEKNLSNSYQQVLSGINESYDKAYENSNYQAAISQAKYVSAAMNTFDSSFSSTGKDAGNPYNSATQFLTNKIFLS